MINCAIYPRKSQAVENSDSMETQIDMCKNYLKQKYPKGDYEIFLYDGDYGISGHSIKNRHDFQRMMTDIKQKRIQLVLVQRYDRLARNTRDFCNIYHEMEQAGCNLVSVSQQIDTTTPYGKQFMYMQASMAELEWSLTSERIKDANRYAVQQGKCRLSNKQLPFGYTTTRIDGIRKMVIDKEKEPIVRDIFDNYRKTFNGYATARYINEKYGLVFDMRFVKSTIKNPFYHGEYKGNKNYCEAYLSEDEQNSLLRKGCSTREIPQKRTETLFAGLIPCPCCGRMLTGKGFKNGSNYLRYYKCRYYYVNGCVSTKSKSEIKIEKYLIENIELYLAKRNILIEKQEQKSTDYQSKISDINREIERLNTMFQKGRISEDKYDMEYLSLTDKKALYEAYTKPTEVCKASSILVDDWKDIYNELNPSNKKRFWREIIKTIVMNEDFEITDIIFL